MRLLSLFVLSALFVGGCATSGGVPDPASDNNVTRSESEQAVEYRQVTGSRIRHPVQDSSIDRIPPTTYPITVYGRDDIEGTSETDALDSLRFLDPRFFR